MKNLLFILTLLPTVAFSQTQRDYEQHLARFMAFYNRSLGDSIANMWAPNERTSAWMWSADNLKKMHDKYGDMVSYKYIGIDTKDPNPGLAVFRTKFTKAGEKATSLTLVNGYLATFRFITSSPEIRRMLKDSQ